MSTAYHADGTKTRSHPAKHEVAALNYENLTPKHRPYQGTKCLVRLLDDTTVQKGPYKGHTCKASEMLWARKIHPQRDTATRLHYAKNDDRYPGLVVPIHRCQLRLAEYEFIHDGYKVTVNDNTASTWSGGVSFIVRHLGQVSHEAWGELKRDRAGGWCEPTVNFSSTGAQALSAATARIHTMVYMIELLSHEYAHQLSQPNAKLAKPKPQKRRKRS